MAETFALPKKINGLEKCGFTSSIGSNDKIDTWIEIEPNRGEQAQVLDLEPLEDHDEKRDAETSLAGFETAGGIQIRMGITTYRQSSSPCAVTTQLEVGSMKPMFTCG